MSHPLFLQLAQQLSELKQAGLYKHERYIMSPQQAEITVQSNDHAKHVLNFCANNYLGLADHPALIETAQHALKKYGFGMASVRFICGTQTIHKTLENKISEFLTMDDTILYSSCFDANTGLFETILSEEDAIISDELNHASIIDGVRLCKAKRFRYKNNNMPDLEAKLIEANNAGARHTLIATDGVFSMDGIIANLKSICDLAEKYNALVMVDDSHAVGFMGEQGRGTPELCGVLNRVHIITGTLGKALGGASGGYVSARGPIVEYLRNRSRPYLFSNTVTPMIVATSLHVLEMLQSDAGKKLRKKVLQNALYFREKMTNCGFQLIPGEHAIVPVMLGDAKIASEMADQLLQENIYVIGFSYPVVPMNLARIRVQLSAAHTTAQIDLAVAAFEKIGKKMRIISVHDKNTN